MNKWNPFSYPPAKVVKAIWGFILPGAALLLNAYTTPDNHVGTRDFVVAFLTSVVTGYTVFAATNQEPQQVPNEGGAVGIVTLLGFFFIVLGVLGLLSVISIGLVVSVILLVVGVLLVVVGGRGRAVL